MLTARKGSWLKMVAIVAAAGAAASGQTFGIDDNPRAPLTGYMGFGFGAEDPYGLMLPPVVLGKIGPSPSLLHPFGGPFIQGMPLKAMAPFGPPIMDCVPPDGVYVDAFSADHEIMSPAWVWLPRLEFSVDRWTNGLGGTPLNTEWNFNQQPGDVYMAIPRPHPGQFVGSLGGGPFAGVLPTSAPGPHALWRNQGDFGLTAGMGVGVIIPAGVPAPPIVPGSHDNLEAYNDFPFPMLDLTGDMISEVDYFFSLSPDEAAVVGMSPADILDVAAGFPGTAPVAYAPAPSMGLDIFGGPFSDDIDALILWDNGKPLGPHWGGPGGEPAIDYALFSLSNGSVSLFTLQQSGLPADGSTVFFTDFTGAFAVYCFGSDLSITSILTGDPWANIDALEIFDCYADYNQDLTINTLDVLTYLNDWVPKARRADCNHDGVIDTRDVLCFLNFWNAKCPF